MTRYDRVVGWRTVTRWETMDTLMERGEGVSPLRVSSMVQMQLREKDQDIQLADLQLTMIRLAFHSED